MYRVCLAIIVAGLPNAVLAQTSGLQLVREIGVEDGPEQYAFGRVGGVALTPTQEILVLDAQAKLVRKYDLNGTHVHTFGREGAGPGEFLLPGRLRVVRNQIWVSDSRLQRLTIFALNGNVTRTVTPPAALGVVDVAFPLRDSSWLGERVVANFSSRHVEKLKSTPSAQQPAVIAAWRAENASRLVLASRSRTQLDTIASWDRGSIPWLAEDGSRFGFLSRTWGSQGEWGLGGDSIVAHVSSTDGSVRVWAVRSGSLQLVKSGRLPVDPEEISTSEINRLTAQERARVGRPVRLITPTVKGQFGPPIISNRGDVWILRTTPDPFTTSEQATREYLVVPIDGRAQHRVVLPAGFVLYAVENNLLLGKRRTDNDVDIVQIWRLTT